MNVENTVHTIWVLDALYSIPRMELVAAIPMEADLRKKLYDSQLTVCVNYCIARLLVERFYGTEEGKLSDRSVSVVPEDLSKPTKSGSAAFLGLPSLEILENALQSAINTLNGRCLIRDQSWHMWLFQMYHGTCSALDRGGVGYSVCTIILWYIQAALHKFNGNGLLQSFYLDHAHDLLSCTSDEMMVRLSSLCLLHI